MEIQNQEEKADSKTDIMPTEQTDIDDIKGIHGWLFLLAIVVCLMPFRMIVELRTFFLGDLNNGTFYNLMSSESAFYIKGFFSLIYAEMLVNILFFFASLVIMYLFFKKHRLFPLVFKTYLIINIFFIIGDYYLSSLITPTFSLEEDKQYIKEIIQAFFGAAVWGWYVHVSQRVKNTFVENDFHIKNTFSKIVIGFALISFAGLLSQVNFQTMLYGKNSNADYNYTTTMSTGVIIDHATKKIGRDTELDNQEGGLGFSGKNGSIIVSSPEKLTPEDIKNLNQISKEVLLEEMGNVFAESMELKIESKKIHTFNDHVFYTYEGQSEFDGINYHYFMGYTFTKDSGINVYSYGFQKEKVKEDGIDFLESIQFQD